jgi:hypothetical protein
MKLRENGIFRKRPSLADFLIKIASLFGLLSWILSISIYLFFFLLIIIIGPFNYHYRSEATSMHLSFIYIYIYILNLFLLCVKSLNSNLINLLPLQIKLCKLNFKDDRVLGFSWSPMKIILVIYIIRHMEK